jgi:hypothetical protein
MISQLQEQSENCRFLASVIPEIFPKLRISNLPEYPSQPPLPSSPNLPKLGHLKKRIQRLQLEGVMCEQN